MLQLLLTVLLAAHLAAINLAAGGPLCYALLPSRRRTADPDALRRAQRRLGLAILAAYLIGTAFGFALALPIAKTHATPLMDNLEALRSKVVWGAVQWGVTLAVWLVALGLMYRRKPVQREWGWLVLLGALAATNLLYHFPPLFTVLATPLPPSIVDTASTAPAASSGRSSSSTTSDETAQTSSARHAASGLVEVRPATFRRLMLQPPVLAMWLHVTLAALATSGLALAYVCSGGPADPAPDPLAIAPLEPPHDLGRAAARGIWLAILTTAAQLPVGFWLVASQPRSAQFRLTGGDLGATLLLGLSIVLALGLLYFLVELLAGPNRKTIRRAGLVMLAVILLMCGVLVRLRTHAALAATLSLSRPSPTSCAAALPTCYATSPQSATAAHNTPSPA